jgi:sigma-B regulation protein RsbU (phosphoserine phosphatase)
MEKLTGEDLDFAPCGFLLTDEKGAVISINQTFVDWLGYASKQELEGKSLKDILTVAGRIFFNTHFFPMIRLQGKASEIFFNLSRKDNSNLPVLCNAVTRTSGDALQLQFVFMPVKERGKYEQELLNARRAAEEALEKSDELIQAKKEIELQNIILDKQISRLRHINSDISEISKIVSHDFQERVRKIAVLSDKAGIKLSKTLSEEEKKELDRINLECRKLRHLGVRLNSLIGLNVKTEEQSSLDVTAIIENALLSVRENLGYRSSLLKIDPIPVLSGYQKQLEILFANIFDNSLKFHNDISSLEIRIRCKVIKQNSFQAIKDMYRYSEYAQIEISDNGLGFDLNSKPDIFKIHKSDGEGGYSFGLAFCRKIMDNHRGAISIDSNLYKGTVVKLIFPLFTNNAHLEEPTT